MSDWVYLDDGTGWLTRQEYTARLASTQQALAAAGIRRPDITVRAAAAAGLELAAACVILMGESGGGRMVWGSDPVSTGGIYTKGGPVTQANYVAYRSAMKAGRIGRNGVGDCQLTSAEYQDRADNLGGCWDPYANQLSGFTGLAALINRYGTRNGFRAFNGSGPAAEQYADRAMAQLNTWRARLAGTTEDDLTPEESQMLAEVHAELCTAITAWGGGLTDAQNSPYKLFQFLLRNNVEVHQANVALSRLTPAQRALSATQTPASDEPGLSDADVDRIASALMGKLLAGHRDQV